MMGSGETVSFPSGWPAADARSGAPCALRRFGDRPEDLSVDFGIMRRAELITQLLSLCCRTASGAAVDREVLLGMPVGLRTEAILLLATLNDARAYEWQMTCAAPGCGERSEFQLSVDEILTVSDADRGQESIAMSVGGTPVVLRRPRGSDQVRWLEQPELGSETMLRDILVRPSLDELLASGQTLQSIVTAVDDVMDRFDPLLSFHLRAICPECQAATEVFPDLAGVALERVLRAQRAAIGEVHRIASHYHWRERDILDLPAWRRRSYLSLIDSGAA
jgi:hypothetical protein